MNITFILVNPAVPENIGASARALKTMGFNKLKLVNPPDNYLEKARIIAHGSGDLLEKVEIFPSFEKAVKGHDFLIATSSKKRRTNEEYVHSDVLKQLLDQKKGHINRVAVIFGSEESGLSNGEIRQCDAVSYIPLSRPYPSLNLSHAVMIYAYLLSDLLRDKSLKKKLPEVGSLIALREKTGLILKSLQLKQPHIIEPRIMEKLSLLKDDDVNLLHSICNAFLEKER